MADGSFAGLPVNQGSFDSFFLNKVRETFFTPQLGKSHITYAAFANCNRHLTTALWRELHTTGRLPAGIPVHAPFASPKAESYYVQVRWDGTKRYLSRLAAAAFKEGALAAVQRDSGLEGCHRLVSYPGSERDFNPNNLYFGSGELNRSCLFCKLNFLKRLGLNEDEYAVAIASPGMVQRLNPPPPADDDALEGAAEEDDAMAMVERVQEVDAFDFQSAVTAVYDACVQVHEGDKCCLFYHPGVGAALQHNCGPIPSIVAMRTGIPDLADQGVSGAVRKRQNIERANAITGLDL